MTDCEACDGTGTLDCRHCDGTGHAKCWDGHTCCDDTDRHEHYLDPDRCPSCKGPA